MLGAGKPLVNGRADRQSRERDGTFAVRKTTCREIPRRSASRNDKIGRGAMAAVAAYVICSRHNK
jgi:hypothetical protein